MKQLVMGAKGRVAKLLLAIALLMTGVLGIGLAANSQAYATAIPKIGDKYSGSCYIGSTWYVGSQSYFDVSGFTGQLAGCWATGSFECQDHTAAAPEYTSATYIAEVVGYSASEGWIEYWVYITPPDATDGVTKSWVDPYGWCLTGYQHVGGHARISAQFYGAVELNKASANTDITDDNGCYTLKGATYGIYKDAACTDEAYRMTTDANGYAKHSEVLPGTYWVREISASAGYVCDTSAYKVTVEADKTAKVNGGTVTEIPTSDPVGMLVGKIDAATNAARPEGSASLAGAQFTVDFYGGQFDSIDAAKVSGAAHVSWVFETDEDGFCYLADEYKVSGPDLYHQMDGKTATLPLGTAFITETKAPAGYKLDDGAGGSPKTFAIHITQSGAEGESVYTYNSPEIPDTVERGDYRLMKEVLTTNDEEDQELTRIPIEGVQFQIINASSESVVSPETRDEVAPGGVVCTIATDENGIANTRSVRPQGWDGALAYGTYTVHEVIPDEVATRYKAEYGITLIGVDDWQITISENGQYDPLQIVANHIPQTPLTIQKVDSTTDKAIPLACSFQIYDKDGNLVTYTDHMNECIVDTWTTLESGHVTLPMKLDEGTYSIHEIQAPDGYVLNDEPVIFTVDEWRTWDDPITVTFADVPIRGSIKIVKVDADDGEVSVAGAEYCVKAAEDIATGDGTVRTKKGEIVGYVTTDENGEAQIDDLYLGSYTVYETKSPEGWALDTSEHSLCIESQGQLVPIVVESLTLADKPTTCKLLKVSSTDGSALAGAVFRISEVVAEDDTDDDVVLLAANGIRSVGFTAEYTTDEDGMIVAGHLPHGTFLVEEIKAPVGYVIGEQSSWTICVNDQGFIGLDGDDAAFSDTLTLTAENVPITLDISKIDFSNKAELAGATLELRDADGKLVDTWVSVEDVHRISPILPGTYTLTEAIAPEGYLLSKETVTIEVAETGEVQKAEMANDYTKVAISKQDATTGKELPGAKLTLLDEKGNEVESWTSTDEPHRIDHIAPGEYTLREVTAPDGYDVAEEVTFTVEETGLIQQVVMRDEVAKSGSMPQTGDHLLPVVFGLLALIAAGGVIAACAVKRSRKSDMADGLDSEADE